MNHQYEVLSAVNAIEEYWNEVECKSPRLIQSAIPVKLWQSDLAVNSKRYRPSVVVFAGSTAVGTIDLLDVQDGIAFQLRVLGEAPQKEFYEEILKIVIYNQNAKKKIKKLVFITRTKGAEELDRGTARVVSDSSNLLGFQIEVTGIGGEEFE